MDYERLKNAVKKVEMSDEIRARIIRNCELTNSDEMEENTMNKTKRNRWFKKPTVTVAVVSLCLCFAGVAAAAGRFGFFKNITNWKGAVVGTEYEQASDEIKVTVSADESEITVRAVLADPAAVPYSEIETFGIESYKIMDMSGKVIVKGERTELFALIDGESEITIPSSDIGSGEYKIVIAAFVGARKGDQPLPINGAWECDFSL